MWKFNAIVDGANLDAEVIHDLLMNFIEYLLAPWVFDRNTKKV